MCVSAKGSAFDSSTSRRLPSHRAIMCNTTRLVLGITRAFVVFVFDVRFLVAGVMKTKMYLLDNASQRDRPNIYTRSRCHGHERCPDRMLHKCCSPLLTLRPRSNHTQSRQGSTRDPPTPWLLLRKICPGRPNMVGTIT